VTRTTPRSTRQPGALDAAGLRRVVTVLSTVQIVSWGVLYYAFAALQSSIAADTGWSSVAITGAFSLGQLVSGGVGIWVGRHLDAYGPRTVMTAASLVAVPGIGAVALAPNLAVFYLGWVLTGAAMAGTLYPPAFAALTRWGGTHRVRALTTLTLVAGLASTVFAPLASVLDDAVGWRQAYLVLLAGLVVVTVPLHWWGLALPWRPDHTDHPRAEHVRAQVSRITRSAPFVLLTLANALTALAVFAVVINLVPMLVEQGMSRNLAALALGLGGVGQVAADSATHGSRRPRP
jgi:MFS family permease